jgi:hypothetical protein
MRYEIQTETALYCGTPYVGSYIVIDTHDNNRIMKRVHSAFDSSAASWTDKPFDAPIEEAWLEAHRLNGNPVLTVKLPDELLNDLQTAADEHRASIDCD